MVGVLYNCFTFTAAAMSTVGSVVLMRRTVDSFQWQIVKCCAVIRRTIIHVQAVLRTTVHSSYYSYRAFISCTFIRGTVVHVVRVQVICKIGKSLLLIRVYCTIHPVIPVQLHLYLNISTHSHPGIRATQHFVTTRYVWPGINKDVRW